MSNVRFVGTLVFATASAFAGCSQGENQFRSGTSEAWDAANAPSIFGVTPAHYQSVPEEAALPEDGSAWSGDYWATEKGGISFRWQQGNLGDSYRDYLYQPLTAQAAARLSSAELSRLSPSEKYDLYVGRSTFALTKAEKAAVTTSIVDGEVPSWHGICHGWAAAATREEKPGDLAQVTLADGRSVDFYSGDLQALISRTYSTLRNVDYTFIGGRCNAATVRVDRQGRVIDPVCRDVNPGTFHLILGEYIARRQEAFIADVQNGQEVWNQPILGYKLHYGSLRGASSRDPLAAYRAPGTYHLVDVVAQLFYVAETSPQREAGPQRLGSVQLKYTLELNAQDVVIGGEWTGTVRPDFLWAVHSAPRSGGEDVIDYGVVKRLLDASLGRSPGPGPDPEPDPGPSPNAEPGRYALEVSRFELVDDGTLRPTAVAEVTVRGEEGGHVQLSAVMASGAVRVLDRQSFQSGGSIRLSGRILAGRVVEYHVIVFGPDGLRRLDRALNY